MDQTEMFLGKNYKKKEQSFVHLCPSPSISIKVNPDYTFFPYLYRIDKGSHFLRIWSVPTPYLPHTNFGLLSLVTILWVFSAP